MHAYYEPLKCQNGTWYLAHTTVARDIWDIPPGGSFWGSSSCSSSDISGLLSSIALHSVQNMSYSSWSRAWLPLPFIRAINAINQSKLEQCSFHQYEGDQPEKMKQKQILKIVIEVHRTWKTTAQQHMKDPENPHLFWVLPELRPWKLKHSFMEEPGSF